MTSDPFDPWVKGAANLYNARVLGAGQAAASIQAVGTVFVQLYDSGNGGREKRRSRRSLRRSPTGRFGATRSKAKGYDVVLLGPGGADPHRPSMALEGRFAESPSLLRSRSRCGRLVSIRPWRCCPHTAAGVQTSNLGSRTLRSTATNTRRCNSWPLRHERRSTRRRSIGESSRSGHNPEICSLIPGNLKYAAGCNGFAMTLVGLSRP